jgi:DNA polymerase V
MKLEHIGEYTQSTSLNLPLLLNTVPAGFPSPAEDYEDKKLDLNELLIKHPEATYFCRVSGDSMKGENIRDGDLLIVDRAEKAIHGSVVVASIYGEITCKLLDTGNKQLLSANPKFKPIIIGEDGVTIEGVVIHSISNHVRSR